MTEQRFQIGQQFMTRGRSPRLCTITDVLRTYNAAGELVRLRYVATHNFMGQTMTDHDVCDATIGMGQALLAAHAQPPSIATTTHIIPHLPEEAYLVNLNYPFQMDD